MSIIGHMLCLILFRYHNSSILSSVFIDLGKPCGTRTKKNAHRHRALFTYSKHGCVIFKPTSTLLQPTWRGYTRNTNSHRPLVEQHMKPVGFVHSYDFRNKAPECSSGLQMSCVSNHWMDDRYTSTYYQ